MCPKVGSSKESCPNSGNEIIDEEQKVVKHWIEFVILDENKIPLPGVSLQVSSSDKGKAKVGISNEDGLLQIKNIDPGDYKIESDWKDVMVYEAVLIK